MLTYEPNKACYTRYTPTINQLCLLLHFVHFRACSYYHSLKKKNNNKNIPNKKEIKFMPPSASVLFVYARVVQQHLGENHHRHRRWASLEKTNILHFHNSLFYLIFF